MGILMRDGLKSSGYCRSVLTVMLNVVDEIAVSDLLMFSSEIRSPSEGHPHSMCCGLPVGMVTHLYILRSNTTSLLTPIRKALVRNRAFISTMNVAQISEEGGGTTESLSVRKGFGGCSCSSKIVSIWTGLEYAQELKKEYLVLR